MLAKTTMDANTLLYLGEDFAYAYNQAYIRRNYNVEFNRISKATKIFFKAGDGHDKWIDYKKAITNGTGTFDQRIKAALENPAMRLSDDLHEIPTTIYKDSNGYEHIIPPNDGLYKDAYWLEREDRGILDPKLEVEIKEIHPDLPHRINLRFTFNVPVDDCILTLNGLFYPYEHINNFTVLYRNMEQLLPKNKPLECSSEDHTFYDYQIKAYKWKGMKMLPEVKPVEKEGLYIKFPRDYEVNANGLLFYNNVNYDFKKVSSNVITIPSLNIEQIEMMELEDFSLKTFVSTDGRSNIYKFLTRGINNNLLNETTFVRPVKDSLILNNGLDFDYEVVDPFSIRYPKSDFGVDDLLNDTPVQSISFYYGLGDGQGAGLEPGFQPPHFSEIIENYEQMLQDLKKKIMNDYQDNLTPVEENQHRFKLQYKPWRAGGVRLYINGVQYEQDECFTYDKDENTITWELTAFNGGFDILPHYDVTAVYDFGFGENGIDKPDEFLYEYMFRMGRI